MARIKTTNLQTSEISSTLSLDICADQFIQSRRTMGLAPGTVRYYRQKLNEITTYFAGSGVRTIDQLEPVLIRGYLDALETAGHNPGGIHGYYRSLKAFLRWVWDEYDLPSRNPIEKVKCRNRPPAPIEGITMDEVRQCLEVCCETRFPARARAIISLLVDTGLRRSELLGLTFGDVRLSDGRIVVRHGKGDKFRIVYCGRECRKALKRYVACLEEIQDRDPFWLSLNGEPLAVDGVREILRRVQRAAGLPKIHDFHDFRRCFALERKRNGDDDITISRALGHSSLEVTKRYLAFTCGDDQELALRSSPMDNYRGYK